jgi:hypothetical protein
MAAQREYKEFKIFIYGTEMKGCFLSFLIFLVFHSCNPAPVFKQANDKDLTIQLTKLPKVSNDEQIISYKVRLLPVKTIMETKSYNEKNNLWYKMDSCFYFETGSRKIYPQLVQPVANGISGSYEYLLQFDEDTALKKDSLDMVYADRYINRKKYTIEHSKE